MTQGLTRLQRWSHYISLLILLLGFLYGLNLRETVINRTRTYVNIQAGIRLEYPSNWLIDENSTSYLFRVRDMTRIGFKTTIQVSIEPLGEAMTPRGLLNSLALQRSTELPQYNTLSIDQITEPEQDLYGMTYYFTTSEVGTGNETLPIVVIGRDVLTIVRGQAIITTFRADAQDFSSQIPIFERFLDSLEFQ